MRKYVIAIYLRLSIEDVKTESISIEAQRLLLRKYAENLSDNAEIIEYVDNGYSGTNFERPAVQELLDDVQNYKIDCILVKDFSRFGRNSIEVGYFTQQIFPLFRVRFISVSDQYDSDEHKGDTGGMEVAFKYLVNEFYSRDLSVKIKTAKYTKMRRGEYNSGNYPYGYLRGDDGKPVIDENVSDTVKMIFDLAVEGRSGKEIATMLSEKKIPTPAQYRALQGKPKYDTSKIKFWSGSSVLNIIRNEIYMGMFVMCKTTPQDVGSHKMVERDKSEWIKIPDHYPAIISEEIFRNANEAKTKRKHKSKQERSFLLRSKVVCGCCKHNMPYRTNKSPLFYCDYTFHAETEPCHRMSILEEDLHKILYDVISKQAEIVLNTDISQLDESHIHTAQIAEAEKKIAECQKEKQRLYEQLVSKLITLDEFKRLKEQCNEDIQNYSRLCEKSRKAVEEVRTSIKERNNLKKVLDDAKAENTLTQALVDALIDKVYVYPDNHIAIEWKIADFCKN